MPVNTDATWAKRTAKAILLIRILVGWVFLSELFSSGLMSYNLRTMQSSK
jgi:hypothetical protein